MGHPTSKPRKCRPIAKLRSLLRSMDDVPVATLEEIVGSTDYQGPTRSLEDMDEAIEKEARRRGEERRSGRIAVDGT